jgi:NADH dehydrogenase
MGIRIAIFGGSGFVGGYLTEQLLDAGHEPSLLVRPGSEEKIPRANRCRLVTGDLGSRSAIDETIAECDAVIYCVGILRENRRQGITFEALQYRAVVQAIESAKSQGISRFLLMSANGVKPQGTAYQQTKYRAEEYLKEAAMEFTIFRPSVIFGDPRGKMEIATQLYRDMIATPVPAIGFFSGLNPGKGQVLLSPVHVDAVARAFSSAVEDPATIGQTYTLGGPETLSWSEMLRRIARATGRNKWILPMPIGLMKVGATLLDWIPVFPVTRDQLKMLAEGNSASAADLETLIGNAGQAFVPENLAYLVD